MPKSSSFTRPSVVDEHVGRLDVPVDDQVRVRMRDRREHVEEEAEPRFHVEEPLSQYRSIGSPEHVLEDEIRLSARRDARHRPDARCSDA